MTKRGQAKVLDFGLAKLLAPQPAAGQGSADCALETRSLPPTTR